MKHDGERLRDLVGWSLVMGYEEGERDTRAAVLWG